MLQVFDQILNILDVTCMATYVTYILTPKSNKKYRPLFVIIFAFVLLATNASDKTVPGIPFQIRIATVINLLFIFLYILILFKEPFGKKCIQFVFVEGVLYIVDCICALVMFRMYNLPIEIDNIPIDSKIFAHLLYLLISTVVYLSAFYYFKKKAVYINKHQGIILILFITMEIFMILNTVYVHRNSITTSLLISLIIEMVMCIIIDIVVVFSMEKITQIAENKNHIYVKQLNEKHIKELEKENKRFRVLRHDIKNTISVAEILLDENKNNEAKKLLDGFTSNLNTTINKNN